MFMQDSPMGGTTAGYLPCSAWKSPKIRMDLCRLYTKAWPAVKPKPSKIIIYEQNDAMVPPTWLWNCFDLSVLIKTDFFFFFSMKAWPIITLGKIWTWLLRLAMWLSFTKSDCKEMCELIRVVEEFKLSITRFCLALENSQDITLVIPLSDISEKRHIKVNSW